jgi:hypothetical protein
VSAVLCLELDCNAVYDGASAEPCPLCGSVVSYPLAAWLNRRARASARLGSSGPVRALIASPAA